MTIKSATKEGSPVQILSPEGDGFKLEKETLKDILYQSDVKDKRCAVISVAGAFRKGKSFLLNFFVNYLESLQKKGAGKTSWCSVDTVLDKFHWRCGSKQDTHGIYMWSQPFMLEDSDGEEIAVFLLDTQGSFDSNSTFKQCASIFALSTMVSSLQIYNLSMNLQEDDLQNLSLFTEYAKLAGGETKPFQQLMFLIRDWQNSDEFEYGYKGGEQFLKEKLKVKSSQPKELRELRQELRSGFQSLECYLMPHPGLKVANNNKSQTAQEADKEFMEHVEQYVPSVFAKNSLVVKTIAGSKITCKQLMQYFESYTKIFNSGTLPEPKSILKATAEVVNINALSDAKVQYEKEMNKHVYASTPLADSRKLVALHEKEKAAALVTFDSVRKLGGNKFSDKYREDLEKFTEAFYSNVKSIVDANEKLEQRKLEQARLEREAQARIKAEQERLERERQETERREREAQARIKAEKERMERERQEQERQERENRARLERERREHEARMQREREEMARQQREAEKERQEQARRAEARMEELRRQEERRSYTPTYYQPSYSYQTPSYSPAPSFSSSSSSSGSQLRAGYSFDPRMGSTGRYRAPTGRICKESDAFE